jgi:phage repressor protein C with HTH and peptisase S24 domain
VPAPQNNDYVGCPDVQDKDAFAARVHGDSMSPKYHEGDILIFSPALPARNGDDCFVQFADGHPTFKRVFFEGGSIRLQPRNEVYRPRDQIRGMYY